MKLDILDQTSNIIFNLEILQEAQLKVSLN